MASIQFKIGKSGKKTYYVVVSQNNKHKWIKAGTQKNAKILKKEIETLENSKRIEKLGLTTQKKRIDDFLQEYSDYVRLRTAPSTVKRYLCVLNTFITFLKMFHPNIKFLTQITPEIIESYQKIRLESIELKIAADGEKPGVHSKKRLPKPQTVNNEVVMIGASFIWAHKRDLISSVPTKNVKKLRAEPKRQPRLLTSDECKLLFDTGNEKAKVEPRLKVFLKVFQFLLNTGLRSGELCNLTWNDVNLKTGMIKIQPKDGWTPKSFSRQFYLNDVALKVLKSVKHDGHWIFQNSAGKKLKTDDIRRALIKISRQCGLNDLTRVHDLRHTFSSHMQMNGVDPGTIAAILGHRNFDVTMIYTHQTEEHLKKSIEKVGIG